MGDKVKFARGFHLPTSRDIDKAFGPIFKSDQQKWYSTTQGFNSIPQPTSQNDWLAQYPENGQSVKEFLDFNPWIGSSSFDGYNGRFVADGDSLSKRYPNGKIYLAQIGLFNDKSMNKMAPDFEVLRDYTSRFYGIDVANLGSFTIEKDSDSDNIFLIPPVAINDSNKIKSRRIQQRRLKIKQRTHGNKIQLNCPSILSKLKNFIPNDGLCLIALTMYDLYESSPDLFVAGLAEGINRVALFSFARYDPCLRFSEEFWYKMRLHKVRSTPQRKDMILARCCKLLVHEVGHLFGFDHCIYFDCCMNGSGHLEEDFRQSMFFCPVCLKKLHHLLKVDFEKRYLSLNEFYINNKMFSQHNWIQNRLTFVNNL